MARKLPVLSDEGITGEGSLGRDGRRRAPYPADVTGRFVWARRIVFAVLLALWAALPWIHIGGHPAVFLDIERRQFFLFGATANAQDTWFLFFCLTGMGFLLIVATALLGRVWCGWACPQTVFLEALFRPIERLINGPRNVALKRKQQGGVDRLWRTIVTQVVYFIVAFIVAHGFLVYFVSVPRLFAMMRGSPGAHPEAFAWAAVMTVLLYGNFAFFREQLCVVICPYGRLQSVLIDDDSLVVGYDERRGEPRARGKKRTADVGDCVDCLRCVVVCPTAIDIREGLQLDCIACTACIDACDEVMDRLGLPRGLVRYDSLRGLRGEKRRIIRPRLFIYSALVTIWVVGATFAFRARTSFEATIIRFPGLPYTLYDDNLQNRFRLRMFNKAGNRQSYVIDPPTSTGLTFDIPITNIELDSLAGLDIPVTVSINDKAFSGDKPFLLHVTASDGQEKHVSATFVGPKR
ncbi:MAG: cytochrome c oxidase accessory protein CcoG [Polyangiaceae bacterium]|nr:cytochrome c oxidase accessory protein CcoG [Polyangiaceae bacterium]